MSSDERFDWREYIASERAAVEHHASYGALCDAVLALCRALEAVAEMVPTERVAYTNTRRVGGKRIVVSQGYREEVAAERDQRISEVIARAVGVEKEPGK